MWTTKWYILSKIVLKITKISALSRQQKWPFETILPFAVLHLILLFYFWNKAKIFLSQSDKAAHQDIFSLINVTFCSALTVHVWLKVSNLIKVCKRIGSWSIWYVRRYSLLSLAGVLVCAEGFWPEKSWSDGWLMAERPEHVWDLLQQIQAAIQSLFSDELFMPKESHSAPKSIICFQINKRCNITG